MPFPDPARILAFDTALDSCSAAVLMGGEVRSRRSFAEARGHAEAIVPMIGEAMEEAGLAFADLDLIVTARGPGSFAGVRTGIAAARGLALATGCPVLAPSSLEGLVFALDLPAAAPVTVILDGRRGEVFVQDFTAEGAPLAGPAAMAPGDVPLPPEGEPRVWTGNGVALVERASGRVLPQQPAASNAVAVGRAAMAALARGERPVAGFELKPLYLRGADARVSAGRSLLPEPR